MHSVTIACTITTLITTYIYIAPFKFSYLNNCIVQLAIVGDIVTATKFLEESRLEARTLIRQDLEWAPISGYPLIHQRSGHGEGFLISKRISFCPTTKLVNGSQDVTISSIRNRVRTDNIQGYHFGNIPDHQILKRSLSRWFAAKVARAGSTSSQLKLDVLLPTRPVGSPLDLSQSPTKAQMPTSHTFVC